jgi:hypothetical protein
MATSRPRFLLFFNQNPGESCCCCVTLKTAVYIFGALDCFASVGIILQSISIALSGGGQFPDADMSLCALPFAVIGMQGMSRSDVDKLHYYSVFKQIQAIACIINSFLIMFACGDYCWQYAWIGVLGNLLAWYCAYVVWSAEVQVAEGKGLLAQYGRQTAAEMGMGKRSVPVAYSPPMPMQGMSNDPIKLTDS